jgi:Ca2+-binding EF-hand superfamily protein
MKVSLPGTLLLLAGLAVFASRVDAQTAEIQDAADAKLAAQKAPPAPKATTAAPTADHLDFVFVASDRPVLIRLHMRNNDRPYSAAWDDYMKKFFDFFDRNSDGTLDKTEAERAPGTQWLQFHLQGSLGFQLQGQTVRMNQIDTNKDGKVSRSEFAEFYRRGGFSPLQFSNGANRGLTDAVTSTLYKYLDANKDGKLSAEEMTQAPIVLRRLDFDEDEMLTSGELMPGGESNYGFFVGGGMRASAPAEPGFLEVKPETAVGVTKQVLTHYDKDKNGKLSRDEAGIDEALFDRLDRNRDDQLDAKEFAGFFRRDADLELRARLGKMDDRAMQVAGFLSRIGLGTGPVRAEVFNPGKRDMPLAAMVKRYDASGLSMSLGDSLIGLSASDQSFAQFNNLKGFYVQQFKDVDIGKKGVIDRKQATGGQFLEDVFILGDRNGDGKLTEKELNAYLDMQVEGSGSQMQLNISDEGRSVFDVLDADGDNRLSIRELRSAWERMKPLAQREAGLARGDVPRRIDMSVGQAQRRFRPAIAPRGKAVAAVKGGSAPLWFTKMDRNHDGDISPHEFIGRDEDFRKLDADGDGLISGEEARQFKPNSKPDNRNPK